MSTVAVEAPALPDVHYLNASMAGGHGFSRRTTSASPGSTLWLSLSSSSWAEQQQP
jgi:hypothetical protein